jgi:pseudomonalisin
MNKLLALALTTGIGTASCSGGGVMSHMLPAAANGGTVGTQSVQQTALTAPAGWAATATRAATLPGAVDKGLLTSSTPMTIRVGLNLHNVPQLKSAISAHQKLTPSQFASTYGATPAETQSVISYLRGQGFTNVTTSAQLVSATGTAALVTKAFNTKLESFQLGSLAAYVNLQPAYVPTSLGGIVTGVLGLSNAAKMTLRPHANKADVSCLITATPTGQCLPAFNAVDAQTFYDVGSTPAATQTTVAVIAEGDVSEVPVDLQFAEQTQGIPQVPARIIHVGLSSTDTSGMDEWDLDTQSSTGMAGNVKMLFIYDTTSLTDSDIANAYSLWVEQGIAMLGNSSFGECEYQAWLDGSMAIDDNLFMEAAAQGQTMFASTGDTGSSCALAPTNGVPASGPPMVSFPATSPWVIGVGGTSVVSGSPSATYVGEAAWNAGGGGISQFENSTSWQQKVLPTSTGLAATNERGLPDMAMAADATTGAYMVYGQNIPGLGSCSTGCAVGGTSEASPLAMGSYARILSTHVGTLGFAAPYLYQNYIENESNETAVTGPPPTETLGGFHDIITGANGAYTALPGYDFTTGLGTFDIAVMNSQIGM